MPSLSDEDPEEEEEEDPSSASPSSSPEESESPSSESSSSSSSVSSSSDEVEAVIVATEISLLLSSESGSLLRFPFDLRDDFLSGFALTVGSTPLREGMTNFPNGAFASVFLAVGDVTRDEIEGGVA